MRSFGIKGASDPKKIAGYTKKDIYNLYLNDKITYKDYLLISTIMNGYSVDYAKDYAEKYAPKGQKYTGRGMSIAKQILEAMGKSGEVPKLPKAPAAPAPPAEAETLWDKVKPYLPWIGVTVVGGLILQKLTR